MRDEVRRVDGALKRRPLGAAFAQTVARSRPTTPAIVAAACLFALFAFGGESPRQHAWTPGSPADIVPVGGTRAGSRASREFRWPERHLQAEDETDVLRTMHTFFDPVDPTKQRARIDETAALALLEVWRESWEERGWKTRVLTLEDAKRHPNYDLMNQYLDSVPLEGKGGTGYYNRLCYLRWLAMSASGGGWMSDYDTIPLASPPSPNEMILMSRRFTVFEKGVPSLLFGTAQGWDRMAKTLVERGVQHGRNGEDVVLFSDMMALMELENERLADGKTLRHFDQRHDVLEGKTVLTGTVWGENECQMAAGKRAVHFSHNAMKYGKLKAGQGVEDRPQIIRDWIRMYREHCENVKGS